MPETEYFVKRILLEAGNPKPQQDATTAKHRWLIPVILATQEAEIRKIAV
jgi:hypothetical protein